MKKIIQTLSILSFIVILSGCDYIGHQEKNDFDVQAKCAQSAKLFVDDYFKNVYVTEYSNHYNSSMKKCFVHSRIGTVEYLHDAVERKEYGIFANDSLSNKVVLCKLLDSNCNLEVEWRDLLKKYMEN